MAYFLPALTGRSTYRRICPVRSCDAERRCIVLFPKAENRRRCRAHIFFKGTVEMGIIRKATAPRGLCGRGACLEHAVCLVHPLVMDIVCDGHAHDFFESVAKIIFVYKKMRRQRIQI